MVAILLVPTSLCALAETPLRPSLELDPIEFVLNDVRYQIHVPRRSRLSHVTDPGCIRIWHPAAVRTVRFLQLCSAADATLSPYYARRAILTNKARVRYNVNYDVGGGSGGVEGELKGELDLAGKVFVLTCHDQGEGSNSPEWCLTYLRYLEVRDRK